MSITKIRSRCEIFVCQATVSGIYLSLWVLLWGFDEYLSTFQISAGIYFWVGGVLASGFLALSVMGWISQNWPGSHIEQVKDGVCWGTRSAFGFIFIGIGAVLTLIAIGVMIHAFTANILSEDVAAMAAGALLVFAIACIVACFGDMILVEPV